MLNKKNMAKISMVFFLLTAFVLPQSSYADWSVGIGIGDHRNDHRFYRYQDHPHYGLHLHFLPPGYVTIGVRGVRYFYYDGLYYSYVGGDYILVNPPVGAYVKVIPSDFQPLIINGRTYYANNGTYYILTKHHGYKVVAEPAVYAQPATVPAAQDTFPVNIPNNNGGYTTVVIRKSGNGFAGPQGEFYPQFPSVAQLKAMYGK